MTLHGCNHNLSKGQKTQICYLYMSHIQYGLTVLGTAAALQLLRSRHLMFICTAKPVWRRCRNLLDDAVDLET